MNGTAPDTCFTHLENREADIEIALMSVRGARRTRGSDSSCSGFDRSRRCIGISNP